MDKENKKLIYELNKKETKELEKIFKKSSFYKQYMAGYTASFIILVISYWYAIVLYEFDNPAYSEETSAMIFSVGFMIFAGFFSILCLMTIFKRMDLIKKYYEEK